MSKYSDKRVGRGKLIHYREGEDPKHRHHRRKTFNLSMQQEFRKWCLAHNVTYLTITNDGHHWKAEFPGLLVEWWPSSAKLVFDKVWNRSLHVYDIEMLKEQIEQRLTKGAQIE